MNKWQENDEDFESIKPERSQYELAQLNPRDRDSVENFSIHSQQIHILRSRCSILRNENETLRKASEEMRLDFQKELDAALARIKPLESLYQKLTSFWGMLCLLGGVVAWIIGVAIAGWKLAHGK